MDDSLAVRLKVFIDSRQLTNSQFADMCGIPRPSLSQILSGRNKKVSDVLVGLIHKTFPDLSVLWLLFGEGEMNTSVRNTANSDTSGSENRDENSIFLTDSQDLRSQIPLNGLKSGDPASNFSGDERIEYENTILDLHKQIDSLQKQVEEFKSKLRRVSQITVYYDDSTFETFFPK